VFVLGVSSSDEEPMHAVEVNTTVEMPEGAEFSDGDQEVSELNAEDPHRALDIDLDM